MKHYKRFTKEENELLKNIMNQSKTIGEGFKEATKTLNRSESSVSNHYYYSKKFAALRTSKTKQIREKKKKIQHILRSEIEKTPENLQKAFKKTAERTGKAIKTVKQAYYSNNSYLSRHNIGICYVLSSGKKVFINNKNEVKKEFKDRNNIFDKIRNFFNQLFNNQI